MSRRVLFVALWLLVGAVVNIGLTWELSITHQPFLEMPPYMGMPEDSRWPVPVPPSWPPPQMGWTWRGWCFKAADVQYLPPKGTVRNGDELLVEGVQAYSVGWPCLGMRCWTIWDRTKIEGVHEYRNRAFSFARPQVGVGKSKPIMIPLDCVWPAFALNTCFYALLAWSLIRTPRTLRRWHRRRAGRCIACGYDLKGLAEGAVCPECGASRSC